MNDKTKKRALSWPTLAAAGFATIACTLLAIAFVHGEARRKEAPFEGLLGQQTYKALKQGKKTEQHYLGNDRIAPDFELRDQFGKTWKLSDHRGKIVVLNFWTKTCQPCIEEMPSLENLANVIKSRSDIELVAVTVDKNWADVAEVFHGATSLHVLFDPDRHVVRDKFGTKLYPETWVIDKEGVIRLRYDGPNDWSSPLTLDILESLL